MLISLPYKGYSAGKVQETEDVLTTPMINNVRPRDTLEGKLRLGQRPGLVRLFDDVLSNDNLMIRDICSVTFMEMHE